MTDLQAAGIIIGLFISGFGLLFNAIATFKNISSRKLTNYQDLIKSHRDLWKITIDKPEKFERLFNKDVDLVLNPRTYEESRFVNFLLLHMTSGFYFSKGSDLIEVEMMKHDIDEFFSYPIPKQVWGDTKWYYNEDFRLFIDTPIPEITRHLKDTDKDLPEEKL